MPPAGGGPPWADRDISPRDFLAEAARIRAEEGAFDVEVPPELEERRRFSLRVEATSLRIAARATMLDVLVTERGNLVYLMVDFAAPPSEVYVSYVKPREARPIVDPGFGQPGSRIEQLSATAFMYTIDTTGFKGGVLTAHFWAAGEGQASGFAEIKIPDRPAQLL